MNDSLANLEKAYAEYRQGNLVAAGTLGRVLLNKMPGDPRLLALLGMTSFALGQNEEAIPFLGRALAAEPGSVPLRESLAISLVRCARLDEARAVASGGHGPPFWRIAAFVDQQQGRDRSAIDGFRRVLGAVPQDTDALVNLGLLLLRAGSDVEASEVLRKALALRQDQPQVYLGLARALAAQESHAERRALMHEATRRFPDEVPLLVELGLAEGALNEFARAEAAYRKALAIDPARGATYREFAVLLEKFNRIDALDALIADAKAHGLGSEEVGFIQAMALYRRGRLAEALPLAAAADMTINPARRWQLLGQIADGSGDVDRAFHAFTQMNRASAASQAARRAFEMDFPGEVSARLADLAHEPASAVAQHAVSAPGSAPIFIVGFPRSGTTLLDTLLRNVPSFDVREEQPMIERVEAMTGLPARAAILTDDEVHRLRRTYREIAGEFSATPAGSTIVDKFPLNLIRMRSIHCLFPEAKIIMVERHPADVVLSCYMARFQTNKAMIHFTDLLATARLYDLALRTWTRAKEVLPLAVHHVRYEALVQNTELEVRSLLRFLGVEFGSEILDNQKSAANRAHIATASYTQVGGPIDARAVDRWRRYRRHLAPILPTLAPWADHLGYDL